MRKSLFAAVLISLLASSAWAQSAKPNFTGKWSLDAAKSDFGPMPPPEFIIHVIDHKEPVIKITTTQKNQMGESTAERNLSTDGKETAGKMPMMGGEQEVKSTSRWDGEELATTLKLEVQGTALELHDTWALSEGGKVLTIRRVAKTAQGDFTVRTVYNKQ